MLVRYEYDVFGAIRSEVGTSDNPRKFTGKEYESDVKLYYYGARYYDPYIGRFTQRDPIGDGLNWYAYAANNPLKFVDPTGLYIVIEGINGETTTIREMPSNEPGSSGNPKSLGAGANAIYTSLFKSSKEPNEVGIARTKLLTDSKTGSNFIEDIINNQDWKVTIRFGATPEGTEGTVNYDSSDYGLDTIVTINKNNLPSGSTFEQFSLRHKLDLVLTHELSHAGDFISGEFGPSTSARFATEYKAFDREARLGLTRGGGYLPYLGYITNLKNPSIGSRRYRADITSAANNAVAKGLHLQ